MKEKINTFYLIKMKNPLLCESLYEEMKRKPRNWEKRFPNTCPDHRLIYKI